MQQIISWNVASVRSRMPVLTQFLQQNQPDIVLLQEIKATEENFPYLDFKALGYEAVISGQKAYNGVAILSKIPLKGVVRELPNVPPSDPPQARFIQATLPDESIVISVYIPNGTAPMNNPTDTSRLEYKLKWMQALTDYIQSLIQSGKQVLIGGDFNVIEHDSDVYNPEHFRDSALMVPPVREAFQKLNDLALVNLIRRFNSAPNTYSFWDFQGGAWPRNHGILLDFFFATEKLALTVKEAKIYREVRGFEKTSDHAPIGCLLG
ncbi:MAG: exodeoxyribonuclease III [Alphaproteobacteria bacterium]